MTNQRVRVTSPRMAARPRPAPRPATREIDEQTDVGEVYMTALLRSQLRPGLALLGLVALALGGLPLLFILLPEVAAHPVGPVTVAWVVVGGLVFPALLAAAGWAVHTAERVERDFTEILVSPPREGRVTAQGALTSSPVLHAVAVTLVCLTTLLVGAIGLRLSRTTSDFYVASRMVGPRWNASAIGGEYLSGASFLGVAGLIFAFGTDMLWYSVGYTAGHLVLLVLVAAPLRRSGAYTLPDFAEIRLGSRAVRRASSLLVVGVGWLYLLPQFLGAGVALRVTTGAPRWLGPVIVVVVVVANVTAGGMRSVTFVQAFQYWLKLTAIALPVVFLVITWRRDGAPQPVPDADWSTPLLGHDHPVYRTYSLLLALLFGTMGLPHVLVRLYTNPDGRAARRTVLTVVGLLGAFYLFPPFYGYLGRVYVPGPEQRDAMMLLLPSQMITGLGGDVLSALLTAGAFAAFLSTSTGLTIAVAGVLGQDLLRGRFRESVRGFRVGAAMAVVVPAGLSLLGVRTGLADTVGLAFALAASTFAPLLVLGIWWRGLTRSGALAGLVVGGSLASAAVLLTVSGSVSGSWPSALLAQPAAWSVPVSFAVMVGVSRFTPRSRPPSVGRVMVRLHTPEALDLDRG